MRGVSAAGLLNAWEQGRRQTTPRRALLLLEAASPAEAPDELAHLPIGERDTRLLALREAAFGARLESVVACPACGDMLEVPLDVSDVRVPTTGRAFAPLTVRSGDYEVRFRLPNTDDLIALGGGSDEKGGRRQMLERCLVAATRKHDAVPTAELPEELVAAMIAAMERADPQARVDLAVTCPTCSHQWQSPFDVASYLWTEIESWARRTLWEVHALASAYGWSEADILAMSARRRQVYLEMVGQ